MHTIAIPLFERLMAASGRSADEIERELKLLLAVKLFEVGRVSLGQAAQIAGMGKIAFMDELGRLQIPLIDYDDLDAELDDVG